MTDNIIDILSRLPFRNEPAWARLTQADRDLLYVCQDLAAVGADIPKARIDRLVALVARLEQR